MSTAQEGHEIPLESFSNRPDSKNTDNKENNTSGSHYPLLNFHRLTLNGLGLSDAERTVAEDHLNATTWPTFFLSIENARNILASASQPWSAEDDMVLITLPAVTILSEHVVHSIFFPGRLPVECEDRRKHLRRSGYQTNLSFNGSGAARFHDLVPNGEDIFAEMISIRDLLVARKEALLALRKHSAVKPSTGAHQVSFPDLLRGRELLYRQGWPGRYRDLECFAATAPNFTAKPSDADANSLYALISSSKNRITWNTLRKVFFPAVPNDSWEAMILGLHSRRRVWSAEEIDELQRANEMDELEKFATDHGRTLEEVTLKASRKFVRKPNSAVTNAPSIPTSSARMLVPRYSAVTKHRKSRSTASSAPTSTVQHNIVQPKAAVKDQPLSTDDMMYNVLKFYPSDAYNIVRLRAENLSFETLSFLSFRGTYTTPQLMKVHEVVSKQWEEIILTVKFQEFEELFKEGFAEHFLHSRDEGAHNQPSSENNSQQSYLRMNSAQAARFDGQYPHSQPQSHLIRSDNELGNLEPGQRLLGPIHDAQPSPWSATTSSTTAGSNQPGQLGHRGLTQGNIYRNEQYNHTLRSIAPAAPNQALQQPGITFYDPFACEYLPPMPPQTQPFRDPALNFGIPSNSTLGQTPRASNQSPQGVVGIMSHRRALTETAAQNGPVNDDQSGFGFENPFLRHDGGRQN